MADGSCIAAFTRGRQDPGVAGLPASGVGAYLRAAMSPKGSIRLACAAISPKGSIRRANSTAGGLAPCQTYSQVSKLKPIMGNISSKTSKSASANVTLVDLAGFYARDDDGNTLCTENHARFGIDNIDMRLENLCLFCRLGADIVLCFDDKVELGTGFG